MSAEKDNLQGSCAHLRISAVFKKREDEKQEGSVVLGVMS